MKVKVLQTTRIINGIEWKFRAVPITHSEDTIGTTYADNELIYIRENLSEIQTLRTLRHELNHAFAWSFGFSCVTFTQEVSADFQSIYGDAIDAMAISIIKELFVAEPKKVKKENNTEGKGE